MPTETIEIDRSPEELREQRAHLDRSLVSGLAWTGSIKWLSQIVSWVSTVVVARLLLPGDYGIVGMATAYLGLITLLSEFGLGAAIVSVRDVSESELKQLNSLAICFGLAGLVLAVVAVFPVSAFFGAPQLVGVGAVLGFNQLIASFRVVPSARMQRGLRFRRLAMLEGSQALIVSGLTVAAAVAGFGYWTLVIGILTGTAISTTLAVASQPCGFARPQFVVVRRLLNFSSHLLVQRLSWYLHQNSDFVVVGRVLGQVALGTYSLGWQLANMAIEKITALVVQVTPGIFSAVQTDKVALRRYLLKLTEGLSLLTFPFSFGLAVVADDFVLLALGDEWTAAITPLRVLALYTALRSLTPLLPQILNVTGESRFLALQSVATAILLPIGFLIGAQWGTVGVATTWLVCYGFICIPLYRRVSRAIDLTAVEYLSAIAPAASSSLIMVLAVVLARAAIPQPWPLMVRLPVEVIVGMVTYGAALFLVHGDRVRQHRTDLALIRG